MKSYHLKPKIFLILLMVTSALFAGCAASRIEKSHLIHVPELNSNQAHIVGDSILVYGILIKSADTEMHVKKFRLTYLDDNTIELRHGLFYSIDLYEISHTRKFSLAQIFKKYGYPSVKHYIKEQADATPIYPGSEFIALPIGKGKQLFSLATEINSMWRDGGHHLNQK